LDLFKDYLWSRAVTEGKIVVLIIDEAQTLKPPALELLRQLINYETNDTKLLQLVLFAQNELRSTLARPALRNFKSRFVMASTLEPLTPDEMPEMITFRWQVASGGAQHPFTKEAIRALFDYSAGMPREANILADNSLLLAFNKGLHVIPEKIVAEAAEDRESNLSRREAA
jgi:MSHA biogenesis protein MshM